jgi:lipoprotein-releasing system ATP-binding protein
VSLSNTEDYFNIHNTDMLIIKNISKSFPQRGSVLDELCLEVKKGDSMAIMGPSGSGKTTLMNIIGLLDKPDSGEITFNGSSIASFSDNESAVYRNSNIGFVFQDHLLLPHLTVFENISLPLLASKHTSDEIAAREKSINDLMNKTGIADLSYKFPITISGGEAQRVALVRALANSPSLLLADEPTGSLDEKNADILGNLLVEINMALGITLIVATHSPALAKKMLNIFHLEDGKLIS